MSLLSVPLTIGGQGLAADLVLLGTSPRAKASVSTLDSGGGKEGEVVKLLCSVTLRCTKRCLTL